MSVIQSNISTTIRSFNITDDIRIEVKKFRTSSDINDIDIEDEDNISVIQRIQKQFCDENKIPNSENLKEIISRLDAIEKKLENIIYMNTHVQQHLINQQSESLAEQPQVATSTTSNENLKLVEFPINNFEDLRELESTIISDQNSFMSFVNFVSSTVKRYDRDLTKIVNDLVTDNLLIQMSCDDSNSNSILKFYTFSHLLYDIWKIEGCTTRTAFVKQLENLVKKVQNRSIAFEYLRRQVNNQ
uniref:DUF4806 domain-containing protein n=1 Tax=Corethrella appendiculata TaxID=1370023 RepID=U5ESI3_9DIPT